MRIESKGYENQAVKNSKNIAKNDNVENKTLGAEVKESKKETQAERPAAVYEKGTERKASAYGPDTIKALRAEAYKANKELIDLVDSLLAKQGKTRLSLTEGEMFEVDEETRAKAKEMLSENGSMGIEAVSDRIANFAIAMSGGDKGKLEELRGAIQKGYDLARGDFGGTLPEISEKTIARAFEKLDAWGAAE